MEEGKEGEKDKEGSGELGLGRPGTSFSTLSTGYCKRLKRALFNVHAVLLYRTFNDTGVCVRLAELVCTSAGLAITDDFKEKWFSLNASLTYICREARHGRIMFS